MFRVDNLSFIPELLHPVPDVNLKTPIWLNVMPECFEDFRQP